MPLVKRRSNYSTNEILKGLFQKGLFLWH